MTSRGAPLRAFWEELERKDDLQGIRISSIPVAATIGNVMPVGQADAGAALRQQLQLQLLGCMRLFIARQR